MSFPVETISLGCRLNAYETDRMASLARKHVGKASVVINTCAVTGEAVRQSRQAVRRARKDHPDAEIVVSGCAVQLDPETFTTMPEVDRAIGNGDKLSAEAWTTPGHIEDVFGKDTLPAGPSPDAAPMARAHLEIQNGCDHRCTFCIIPFGRGKARSKPTQDILHEAATLVAQGAKEIVLTGVDLTSYGPDLGPSVSIADPIEALISALPPDVRLRLSSIDGAEVDDRLFELITGTDRIAPHLHLSLQSGDTMILKRMKRRHTRQDAVDLCRRIKTARPDIAFGADLIAGFPTETDEMFENSLRLIEDCALSYVHVFPFSPRQGTPAAKMPQVARETVKRRASRLRDAATEALTAHLAAQVGATDVALIETSKDGRTVGRLPNFTEVVIGTPLPTHTFATVRLNEVDGHQLIATLETASHG